MMGRCVRPPVSRKRESWPKYVRVFFMMVTIIEELIGLVNTFFEFLWIRLPRELKMRAVLECLPVATPLDQHVFL